MILKPHFHSKAQLCIHASRSWKQVSSSRSAPRGHGVCVGGLRQAQRALEFAEAALAALLARGGGLGALVARGALAVRGLALALARDGQLPLLLVHANLRGDTQTVLVKLPDSEAYLEMQTCRSSLHAP